MARGKKGNRKGTALAISITLTPRDTCKAESPTLEPTEKASSKYTVVDVVGDPFDSSVCGPSAWRSIGQNTGAKSHCSNDKGSCYSSKHVRRVAGR